MSNTEDWTIEVHNLLAEAKSNKERVEKLDAQIAALSEETERKHQEARQAYLDRYRDRFSDIDPVRALAGAPQLHTFKVGNLSAYRVQLPTGNTTHAVRQLVQNAGNLGPVSNDEVTVVSWLQEVELLPQDGEDGPGPQKLQDLPAPDRLKLIRGLPTSLLERLADECVTLQTWLNVYLEENLGNS